MVKFALNSCRACLIRTGRFSIHSVESCDVKIEEMIRYICDMKTLSNDNLPTAVCAKCKQRIQNTYEFKLMLEHTQETLLMFATDSCQLRDPSSKDSIDDSDISDDQPIKYSRRTKVYTEKSETKTDLDKIEVNKRRKKKHKKHNTAKKGKGKHKKRTMATRSTSVAGTKMNHGNKIDGYPNDNYADSTEEGINEATDDLTVFKGANKETKNVALNVKAVDDADLNVIEEGKKKRVTIDDIFKREEQAEWRAAWRVQARKRRLQRYVCATCGYTARDRCTLQVHERAHTGERPYRCSVCGKTFAVGVNLKVHMRKHTGERPFVCDVCGRAFAAAASLRGHARTHSGERPYACAVCPRAFALASNLRHHALLHSGQLPHKCTVCQKGFKSASDLRIHDRTHTGERPFACIVCEHRFSHRSNLRAHTRTHRAPCRSPKPKLSDDPTERARKRGERSKRAGTHACSECGQKFVRKSSLVAHSKKHVVPPSAASPAELQAPLSDSQQVADETMRHQADIQMAKGIGIQGDDMVKDTQDSFEYGRVLPSLTITPLTTRRQLTVTPTGGVAIVSSEEPYDYDSGKPADSNGNTEESSMDNSRSVESYGNEITNEVTVKEEFDDAAAVSSNVHPLHVEQRGPMLFRMESGMMHKSSNAVDSPMYISIVPNKLVQLRQRLAGPVPIEAAKSSGNMVNLLQVQKNAVPLSRNQLLPLNVLGGPMQMQNQAFGALQMSQQIRPGQRFTVVNAGSVFPMGVVPISFVPG